MNFVKKIVALALATVMTTGLFTVAAVGVRHGWIARADIPTINCGTYKTVEDWNISYAEILELTDFTQSYKDFDTEALKTCSDIITSVAVENAQFYRQETDKLEVKSLKFGGSSSKKGVLTLTLNRQIDAIGFYADAYQAADDQNNKTLSVNGITTKTLGHSYVYDLADTNQRFFIEFPSAVSQVTIAGSVASKNRFHIYSIGFYSKSNFPDAGGGGSSSSETSSESSSSSSSETSSQTGEVITKTFNFSTKGYTNGQAVASCTETPITITFDKGSNSNAPKYYDTGKAIRCYGGNTFTITGGTIISVTLTFSSGEGTNAITTNTGTYSSGSWSGSTDSLIFTIGGTSGHRRVAQVVVQYQL